MESITDALQEIELIIDEEAGAPYRIGDSFYTLGAEEAKQRMEEERGSVEREIGKMEDEIAGIKEELDGLKSRLYGKFGSSINLEK